MAGFGMLLKTWREARGHSQQHLAGEAGMSTRHLSFLETGRSGPSEETVIRLGAVLELPDREIQRLLYAAGYASDWNRPPSDVTPGQLARVTALLPAQEPFPAFVTDPKWRIVSTNRGGDAFFGRCLELNPSLRSDPFDIGEIVIDPTSMGRIVTNADAIRQEIIAGLFELAPDPTAGGNTELLYERVAGEAPEKVGVAPPVESTSLTSGAWEVVGHFADRGEQFAMELLALPFGGPCAGFGLLLTNPASEADEQSARRYFAGLGATTDDSPTPH